jgi:multiple sugar transport system substrate-binding protein
VHSANLSSLVVYYNKTCSTRPGWLTQSTIERDDFLKTAQALTKDTDGDGKSDQHGLGTEASIFRLAPLRLAKRRDIVDDPYFPRRLALDEPGRH